MESLQETKNTVESLEKRLVLVTNHQQHHEKMCNNTLLNFQSSIPHCAIYDNAPEFFRTKFGVTVPTPETLNPEQVAARIPEILQMQRRIAILLQYRVQLCIFNAMLRTGCGSGAGRVGNVGGEARQRGRGFNL